MKFTDGPHMIHCQKADIHLHYANNRGRGSDNVTVTVVKPGTARPSATKFYGEYRKNPDVIEQYRIAGWRGIVNISSDDIKKYGGLKI